MRRFRKAISSAGSWLTKIVSHRHGKSEGKIPRESDNGKSEGKIPRKSDDFANVCLKSSFLLQYFKIYPKLTHRLHQWLR